VAGRSELLRVDAELGLGVSGQRVVGGQLFGDLPGQTRLQALGLIDTRQLHRLGLRGSGKLAPLECEHRLLGIALATDRHVLPRRHRQRPGEQPRQARGKDRRPGRGRTGYADDQARRRDDSVVRAQDRGAQPVEPGCHAVSVRLGMARGGDTGQAHSDRSITRT